jgi:hypothetical protein
VTIRSDPELDMCFEVRIDLDEDVEGIDAFDRTWETHFARSDLETDFLECVGDVLLGDGAVEVTLIVASAVHGEFLTVELVDHFFALLAALSDFLFRLSATLCERCDQFFGRLGRVSEWEEVVACVADLDIDDIADDPEGLDILCEEELD